MEVGPVATEFEQEDISTTLAKCHRYYYATGYLESTGVHRIVLSGNNGTVPVTGIKYPYTMRAAPTLNYFGGNSDGGSFVVYAPSRTDGTAQTAPSSATIGPESLRWNFTTHADAAKDPHWMDVGTASTQFGWTQDAEL